jgi:hypothetical protein
MKNVTIKIVKKSPKKDLREKLSIKLHQAIKSLGIDSVLLSKKIEKSTKKLVKSALKKKALKPKSVSKPLVSSVSIKKPIQTKPLKAATPVSRTKPKTSTAAKVVKTSNTKKPS